MRPPRSLPGSVVIVKPGSLGDIVHALPVASALKAAHPRCKIQWVVDERWKDLLAGHPAIDSLLPFPRNRFRGKGYFGMLPWAVSLRKIRPGLCIDLQGLLRSALISRVMDPGYVIGLGDAREGSNFFYDFAVPVPGPEHSVLRYLRVLSVLDIPIPDPPDFGIPPGSAPVCAPPPHYVVLHPFARGKGKSLSPHAVEAFCRAMAPTPVLIVGGPAQLTPETEATNLLGQTTIPELLWIIRQADYLVSVDSGPVHLAAAVGCGVLAIHTWSDTRKVGPYCTNASIWQDGKIFRQEFRSPPPKEPKEFTHRDAEEIAAFVRGQIVQVGHPA